MQGKVFIVLAVCSAFLAGLRVPVREQVANARAQTAAVSLTFGDLRRLLGYEVVLRGIQVPAGDFRRETVRCPRGKEILGGGAQVIREGSANFHTAIQESGPGTYEGRYLWSTAIRNDDTVDHKVGLFAICADMKKRLNPIG
jgi:hypothetical protein